jgi:hypothetical protein
MIDWRALIEVWDASRELKKVRLRFYTDQYARWELKYIPESEWAGASPAAAVGVRGREAMSPWVTGHIVDLSCPSCGESTGSAVANARGSGSETERRECPGCGVIITYTLAKDGTWFASTAAPTAPPHPIVWRPDSQEIRLYPPGPRLSRGAGPSKDDTVTTCTCPACGRFLCRLHWPAGVSAGPRGLVGVVLLDGRLKDRREVALADNRLRASDLAAAVLRCRCNTATAFVLKGRGLAGRESLVDLLTKLGLDMV